MPATPVSAVTGVRSRRTTAEADPRTRGGVAGLEPILVETCGALPDGDELNNLINSLSTIAPAP